MVLTRLAADTGGGNMDVVLPDNATDLNVNASSSGGNVAVTVGSGITGSSTINASSGAGNVVVHMPSSIAARIHATTGLGKLTIAPQFIKIDDNTYQSPGYDSAANTLDVTVESGAGDVSVITQ
jgi:predicted membrane protein